MFRSTRSKKFRVDLKLGPSRVSFGLRFAIGEVSVFALMMQNFLFFWPNSSNGLFGLGTSSSPIILEVATELCLCKRNLLIRTLSRKVAHPLASLNNRKGFLLCSQGLAQILQAVQIAVIEVSLLLLDLCHLGYLVERFC